MSNHVQLTVKKIDSITGAGLSGAVFELTDSKCNVCKDTTDSTGLLIFCLLPCNTYTLREVSPPPGYRPTNTIYNICVNAHGKIFVNDCPTNQITIANTAISGSFTAIKINIENGAQLAGATFTLYKAVASTISNDLGEVTFSNLPPGNYELVETEPPIGFQRNPDRLPVVVAQDGSVTILGNPATGFNLFNVPLSNFVFRKLDAFTGLPIEGAEFQLTQEGALFATEVSGPDGIVNFGILPAGVYELTETNTLPGFVPNDRVYQVLVGTDGSITVDGIALDDFHIENVAILGFYFTKTSLATGEPLAGAVFQLRQNGAVIDTSTSDMTGFVSFSNLLPESYQLVETEPPAGYMSNPVIHNVTVSDNGTVTIDGLPFEEFEAVNTPIVQSAPPAIDTIYEFNTIITGTGIPGSTIFVTFPDGSLATATVDPNGNWQVTVPASARPLTEGEIVTAVQEEPGKLPSEVVSTTVIPNLLIEPLLDKTVENFTNPGGLVFPGDALQFTILIGNIGDPGSVWPNAYLRDFISEELTFVADTVAIDGQLISTGTGVGQYIYDDEARTLTIFLGDLASGEIREITFLVTVNLDAAGSEIINNVEAGSLSLLRAEPLKTASSQTLIVAG